MEEFLKKKHIALWKFILDFYTERKNDRLLLENIQDLKISWFHEDLKNDPSLSENSFYIKAFHEKEFLCSAFSCSDCPLQKISSSDMGFYVDCFHDDTTFINRVTSISKKTDLLKSNPELFNRLLTQVTIIMNCWK